MQIERRMESKMKRPFCGCCEQPLVSTDFEINPIVSTFDAKAGIMFDPTFVKATAWCDNEWSYSCRVTEWIKRRWPQGLVMPDDLDAKIKLLEAEALRGVGGPVLVANDRRIVKELG